MEMEGYFLCDPRELGVAEPFSKLFRIMPDVMQRVTDSMRERGFDKSKPIDVWRNGKVVLDGHTRRLAAIETGKEVLVCYHDFDNEDDAVRFAIANQRNRRNLTDAEILAIVELVDSKRKQGERTDLVGNPTKSGPSCDDTAKLLNVSPNKVKDVRSVKTYVEKTGDRQLLEDVESGKTKLGKAAKTARAKSRAAKSKAAETKAVTAAKSNTKAESQGTESKAVTHTVTLSRNVSYSATVQVAGHNANSKEVGEMALKLVVATDWTEVATKDRVVKVRPLC
jgi:ParB family chromosome partitioning protein